MSAYNIARPKLVGVLTQGALLKVNEVLLNVLRARRPDEDCVSVLALHQTVVRDPAERDLRHRQVVLLRDGLDLGQRVEVGLVPVARAVELRKPCISHSVWIQYEPKMRL